MTISRFEKFISIRSRSRRYGSQRWQAGRQTQTSYSTCESTGEEEWGSLKKYSLIAIKLLSCLFLSFCPLTTVVSSGGDVAPRNVLICPHLQMNRGGRKRRRRRGFELSPFPLPCPSFSLPLTPFVASMLFALARPPEAKKTPPPTSVCEFSTSPFPHSVSAAVALVADKSDRQRRGAKRKREICKISRSSSSRKTKVEQDGSHIQLFFYKFAPPSAL